MHGSRGELTAGARIRGAYRPKILVYYKKKAFIFGNYAEVAKQRQQYMESAGYAFVQAKVIF